MDVSQGGSKAKKGSSPVGKKPRLLLADDHKDVLEETRELLSAAFEIVRVVNDGMALVAAAIELKPDVVVTDAKMPKLNGIEASREIIRQGLCSAIVLLTVHGDQELVKTAAEAGIRGYVLKVNAGEELVAAVRAALLGHTFVSPDVGT